MDNLVKCCDKNDDNFEQQSLKRKTKYLWINVL